MPTANQIIEALNLEPLEGEGGYFRRTWFLGDGDTPEASAIMYLVTPDSFSALHRLESDEIFHFYLGDACEQISINPSGELHIEILGSDILAGEKVHTIVPAGSWQGTRLREGGEWALLGTTMTPGFHAGGFELAVESNLSDLDPDVAVVATSYIANGA